MELNKDLSFHDAILEQMERERESKLDSLSESIKIAREKARASYWQPALPTLRSVFDAAIAQAEDGKGKERHGRDTPFDRQPLMEIQRMLGSNGFALGQAIKKCQESSRMPPDRAIHELEGALVYIAGAILWLRENG